MLIIKTAKAKIITVSLHHNDLNYNFLWQYDFIWDIKINECNNKYTGTNRGDIKKRVAYEIVNKYLIGSIKRADYDKE